MTNLLIITHGDFGAYLLEAAEEIVGRDPRQEARAISISRRIPLDEVRRRIATQLDTLAGESGDGILILCDMLGGTPCNETLLLAGTRKDVSILTGVNLYMVISALVNSKKLGISELSDKVSRDGQRAVVNAKVLIETKR
ncbi:MAG: hypothetical protein AABZ44_04330 [Elusimicrobiota bacterium]